MRETHLKRTPLYERHVQAGGKMVSFAGWEMPVQYRGVVEEHRAVRTRVGLFDVSHMGEIVVQGSRALDLLQYVTCNDVAQLVDGRAQYSGLMTPRGTFVDDVLVHKVADRNYLLVVNAANKDKDYAYLCAQAAAFPGVDVNDRSAEWAQLAVQGPLAVQVVQRLTPVDLGSVKRYRFVSATLNDREALVARTGYTGEDGFELYVRPADAVPIWDAVLAAGAGESIRPCGLGARDTLRFEQCMPLYGNDIDDSTTPFEAGLGGIVKLDKGPFLGREALCRQEANGVSRKLVGLGMVGRGIARHGYAVLKNGTCVGVVTSGMFSPTLQRALALAYVPVELAGAGEELDVQIREQSVRAKVVPIPFYRRAR